MLSLNHPYQELQDIDMIEESLTDICSYTPDIHLDNSPANRSESAYSAVIRGKRLYFDIDDINNAVLIWSPKGVFACDELDFSAVDAPQDACWVKATNETIMQIIKG